MKFLILAALVAVAAAADLHDDVFHFSTLGSASGLQRSSLLHSSPLLAKQYTTLQASPVYSSFVAQPAYRQQYVKHVASPLLVRNIEQEVPAVYTTHLAQPVYSQQYAIKQLAEPVYSQYALKHLAQPVLSQYSALKQVAQPVYSQYSTLKHVAQPVYSQYSTLKKIAQPALFSQTQYAAKPVIAHSLNDLAGISTYAASYNGPQFRILSQVQEADPAGPYKVSYATENGIQATEQGALIGGSEGAVVAAQGSYSYTGPDGVQYTVNYIADENGFRAAGDHLPTPPPIPAEILKSLEENAQSGEQYDNEGRRILKK